MKETLFHDVSFLQIDGDTEIVRSNTLSNGEGTVYIEKPDTNDGFHRAACFLPEYRWEDVRGFTENELGRFQEALSQRHT